MPIRPAPPSGPPPPYARAISRVYGQKSLRPVVLFVSLLSLIWAIATAVSYMRDSQDKNDTSGMKTWFLVLAILHFAIMGIEIFGIGATWVQRIRLMQVYLYLAAIAGIIATAAEIARLIGHFTLKNDLINVCAAEETGLPYTNVTFFGNEIIGTVGNLTVGEAKDDCKDQWNRDTWYDIGWLVFITVVGFFFTSIVSAFYHQLLDPSQIRTFTASAVAPSSAFLHMGAYPNSPTTPGGYMPHDANHPTPAYVAPPYPGAAGALPSYGDEDAARARDNRFGNGEKHDGEGPFGDDNEERDVKDSATTGTSHRHSEDDADGNVRLEPVRRDDDGHIV